ncbi:DNA translocase FtsK [Serratia rubidaea]|uniref:DNA translocase FtsK n=1 Tax=Serratia rubidaea TaxID=61652 RepID=A0A3S4GMV8_SERRU|nr:DNA translocase FtsK [Serratia rubidaea]
MAALVSFNPSDPSWSQTAWHEPIHNLGGGVGAWLADTLFFTFGVLAYAIPPIALILCWVAYRQRGTSDYIDYFALSLRLIGTLALVLTSCGLAALNVDDLYYFASGGVIGSLLSNAMLPWFNGIGATLALLCVWAAGLTLFTGWSWLVIAEKIGGAVLGVATFMTNRSRRDDRYRDDEDEPYADVSEKGGKAQRPPPVQPLPRMRPMPMTYCSARRRCKITPRRRPPTKRRIRCSAACGPATMTMARMRRIALSRRRLKTRPLLRQPRRLL